jgi:hypothetical protein
MEKKVSEDVNFFYAIQVDAVAEPAIWQGLAAATPKFFCSS